MKQTCREGDRLDGYGKRILIIDDGTGCRALLEAQLAQEGYAVHTAYYGVAGIPDHVRKRRFDAVIADDHMPGFTGSEFAKFCRMTWPNTHLILLIRDRNSLTDYAEESGAATCICTPYEVAMLLNMLGRVTQPDSTEHASSQ
jgi:DNA-binding response OmpR family regulator